MSQHEKSTHATTGRGAASPATLRLGRIQTDLLEEARRALEPVSAEAAEELLGTVGHEDPSQDQPQNQQCYVFHF